MTNVTRTKINLSSHLQLVFSVFFCLFTTRVILLLDQPKLFGLNDWGGFVADMGVSLEDLPSGKTIWRM